MTGTLLARDRAQMSIETAVVPPAKDVWIFVGVALLILIEYLGLAYEFPFLKAARVPTLLAVGLFGAVMIRGDRGELFGSLQTKIFLTFISITILSVAWALVATYSARAITPLLGYLGLSAVLIYAVDRPRRARWFAMLMATIVIVLVLRNLHMLGTEVRAGTFTAGYFLGDGNDFGWGLNVMAPFAMYLVCSAQPLPVRLLGLLGVAAAAVGIVGTSSRGATLAMVSIFFYYWATISTRKVLTAGAAVVVLSGIVAAAPSSYFERMETIASYEEDGSAMGRIRAWGAATRMALDYPLGVGAGNFNSAYGRFYRPDDAHHYKWISTHSIYFKTLAEYGFPGLALLLLLIGSTFVDNLRSRARARETGAFAEEWPAFLNMSLVGYSVAGLFLGGVAYPHIFILCGLSIACKLRTRVEAPVSQHVRTDPSSPVAGGPDRLVHGLINPLFTLRVSQSRGGQQTCRRR